MGQFFPECMLTPHLKAKTLGFQTFLDFGIGRVRDLDPVLLLAVVRMKRNNADEPLSTLQEKHLVQC